MPSNKKNYLEHEIEVKFTDCFLQKNTDWEWFIDEVVNNFEITEICTWDDYLNQRSTINKVKGYFYRICGLAGKLTIKDKILNEIYSIVLFQNGIVIYDKLDFIDTNIGKLILFIAYITKLENVDNGSEFIDDITLLTTSNYYKYKSLKSVKLNISQLVECLNKIEISGFDKHKKCFFDNVNGVEHAPNIPFLEDNIEVIVSVDSFNYCKLKQTNLTYEEYLLNEMLNISIRNGEIVPQWVMGDEIVPNYKVWTESVVNNLKKFFNHEIADFILETINFICNGIEPSVIVQEQHTNLFLDNYIKSTTIHEKYNNSSFEVIRMLLQSKKYSSTCKKDFIKEINKCSEISELIFLDKIDCLFSKSQRDQVANYYHTFYKSIEQIDSINILLEYLNHEDSSKYIDKEYLNKLDESFYNIVRDEDNLIAATAFNKYMIFLINVYKIGNVDKGYINYLMVTLQKKWEKEYYCDSKNSLHKFSESVSIKTDDVDQFSDLVLNTPIFLANQCATTSASGLMTIMENASRNALMYMCSTMYIEGIFPISSEQSLDIDNHDIEKLYGEIVSKLIKMYGYKLLNKLENVDYIKAILDDFDFKTRIAVNMFNKEEVLYEIIRNKIDIVELLEYSRELSLAHATQLFPLLELKIKELYEELQLFPYYIDEKKFMKSKDPSSLLRSVILEVYKISSGLESVPDLIFVYNCMYNGNSLNIRNELMHGRKYLRDGSLHFGFRTTLLCLFMIINRIENIKKLKVLKSEEELNEEKLV